MIKIATFTLLSIACVAAYFSIHGLSLMFAASQIPVIIMASCLEAGKLVATSILVRNKDVLPKTIKSYLIAAIVVLMLITSLGIYGFLSAAFLKSQVPLEQINKKLYLIEQEYKEKQERLKQMDNILAKIGANYITKRMEERKQQEPERNFLRTRLEQLQQEKYALQKQLIDTESHIGPVLYVAKTFDIKTEKVVNFFILLIIFVFDPLAVMLTVTVNYLTIHNKKQSEPQQPNTPPQNVIYS
jgi:ABC-type multidrug transport system fused ATPase/permease subunit